MKNPIVCFRKIMKIILLVYFHQKKSPSKKKIEKVPSEKTQKLAPTKRGGGGRWITFEKVPILQHLQSVLA